MPWNELTESLGVYPMEGLNATKRRLVSEGKKVFDFGTGDPKIPTWAPIVEALKKNVGIVSQYPSVYGTDDLKKAHFGYLKRRHGIDQTADIEAIPTQGSKEGIFHVALSLVGRSNGKKNIIIYPDPGYPVYQASTLFAKGIPYPVRLEESRGYLLEPWRLPEDIQRSASAIWVNYPHNPTGALAPKSYWEELVQWGKKFDVVILADDCYVDIYDPDIDLKNSDSRNSETPISPLSLSKDRVLAFFSLSKRSGMTGYRCGFMAGDARLIKSHTKARANFGVGMPNFIQAAAVVAWNDDSHVEFRKKIFQRRLDLASPIFMSHGLLSKKPRGTFYLWTRIPDSRNHDDIQFASELAEEGVIVSPSSWLSEGMKGYVRFALVPEEDEMMQALKIIEKIIKK